MPDEHAHWFVVLSHLTLLSSAYAWGKGHADLSLATGSVWLSSQIFWRRHRCKLRRNIDIVVVQLALWYHLHRARSLDTETMRVYLLVMGMAVVSFGPAVFFTKTDTFELSTLFHSALHVLANIGNVLLYTCLPPVS